MDHRRGKPTPYMEKLHFSPGISTADPDERPISDHDLEEAMAEGKKQQ